MKRNILLYQSLHIILFFSSISYTQWEPDVRFTDDSVNNFTSDNNAWCIAASGDTVHAVWADNSNLVAYEIYYQRSTDGGLTWGPDTLLSSQGNTSWSPSITVQGSYVYIVWVDQRDGNEEVYFKASSDGGTTWGFDDRLINSSLESDAPSVAASGSDVHVVFREHGLNMAGEIRYRRSTDFGDFWVTNTQLTNNSAISDNPVVAANEQIVHVVWTDTRDGNYEIYYKRSSDGGINWGLDTRLTLDVNNSNAPTIAVSGSFVHVLWQDNRNGKSNIFYKHSTDAGLSWSQDMQITDDSTDSYVPSAAISGSNLHIIWNDSRHGNSELYYKKSSDNGLTWSEDIRLTNDSTIYQRHSLAVSGSAVHVIWMDFRDHLSESEIYYKRNPTGLSTDVNIAESNSVSYELSQNYPNPFNPTTVIQFSIPTEELVTIKIFNLIGEEISTLISQNLKAGIHQVQWHAEGVSSGVYFYQLQADKFIQSKKLILMR